jgi:hypothetical protein
MDTSKAIRNDLYDDDRRHLKLRIITKTADVSGTVVEWALWELLPEPVIFSPATALSEVKPATLLDEENILDVNDAKSFDYDALKPLNLAISKSAEREARESVVKRSPSSRL